jgi:hypothetical protein
VERYWFVGCVVLRSILSVSFQVWVEVTVFVWCSVRMGPSCVLKSGSRRNLCLYLCWWVFEIYQVRS